MIVDSPIAAALSPGYLPEPAGKVKPLDMKGIQNIMNMVCSGYSSCNDEKKFAISSLAIQLQNMMCLSEGEAELVQSKSGDTVMVPTKESLLSQSKNRKKPRHEIEADKAKKKSKNSLVVNTSAVATTIVGKENNILANPKKPVLHCDFCNKNHRVTSCDGRANLKMHALEYILSIATPTIEESLRKRIKDSMPCTTIAPVGVLSTIAHDLNARNFIIHEAYQVNGLPVGQVESMHYCVTFLGKDAKPVQGHSHVWISGSAMNGIVSHKLKKKKYVYDETIVSKEGWVHRGA